MPTPDSVPAPSAALAIAIAIAPAWKQFDTPLQLSQEYSRVIGAILHQLDPAGHAVNPASESHAMKVLEVIGMVRATSTAYSRALSERVLLDPKFPRTVSDRKIARAAQVGNKTVASWAKTPLEVEEFRQLTARPLPAHSRTRYGDLD